MEWSSVYDALTNVWSIVDSCIDFVAGNSVLLMIFTASLLPLGFKIFRKAKRSVK